MKAPKNPGLQNPMPPPWMMYPHIHPHSIGWRMGYGEDYIIMFNEWYNALDDKKQYEAMFPAPVMWSNYYSPIEDCDDYPEPCGYFPENMFPGVDFWNPSGSAKYAKTWLMQQDPASLTFAYFWRPGDIATEPYCCFGQWQYSEFSDELISDSLTCTEQYMMAYKAHIFGDKAAKEEILATTDPKQMRTLGRKVQNFDQKVWDSVKHSIVLNGNYHKFAQNKPMRDILLGTGDKVLVEASPRDAIWGIGLGADNPKAADPASWRGLNMLGFALMEVRDELHRVYKNYDKVDWDEIIAD